MARIPKCKHCQEDIVDKDLAVKKSNVWYHKNCYDKLQEEKIVKKNTVPKKEADPYYTKIIAVINNLYGGNHQIPMLARQIKNFRNTYNIDNKTIYYTLVYYFKICKNDFNEDYGLMWIIERYYYEARDFYIKKKKISEQAKGIDFKEEVVIVSVEHEKQQKYKEIDFD